MTDIRGIGLDEILDRINAAMEALDGVPAALDHIEEDGVGNEVNDAIHHLLLAKAMIQKAD